MKRVLLPTDFSRNAWNAIAYALKFFQGQACDFYVLNVQKPSEYITDDLITSNAMETVYDSIVKDNKKQLRTLIEKLRTQDTSTAFEFHPVFENSTVTAAIKDCAGRYSIDLIVMGSNGATGAGESLFGSNTLQVLRKVECPTLVIPQDYQFSGLERLLYIIDLASFESISPRNKQLLSTLLDMHPTELNVLSIIKEENKAETSQWKQDPLLPFPYRYHTLQESFNWHTLNIATQLLKADLKIIELPRESMWQRIFYGSKNSDLVYHTKVPMLFLSQ